MQHTGYTSCAHLTDLGDRQIVLCYWWIAHTQQQIDRTTIDQSHMPSPALSEVTLTLHDQTAVPSPQL